MARKRQFDSEEVLKSAARVFSHYGYAGSSIDQLTTATGLQRGSLYKAYASKAGLFRECLQASVLNVQRSDESERETIADLVVVAIWERASIDKKVSEYARECLAILEKLESKSIEDILYTRLAKRATFLG
jgi:AcrR family transcriptional regulator